ncbi:MAG: hypothetical protein O2968_00145 [Acidobacteria bacterium]|nr:hypothetical protein [Acidobacteriota bacterium]
MTPLLDYFKRDCGSREAVSTACVALFSLSLLTAGALPAATSQVWETTEYEQFAAGRLENLSLRPDGSLVIAGAIETVYSSDQPLIWSVAAAPDGSLYLGTGHQGNIYRIDPNGKSQLFWSAPEIEVFAIVVAPDGSVFAGTSPHGKVYRIKGKGQHEVYFDPQETYIWALAFGNQKSMPPDLFVGTGENGKIYHVTAQSESEAYYESGQRHVVSLALDAEGRLLAGTDPNGVLYRIEHKGKAFALYDSDLPEIRDLQVTANGEIFAAAVGGGYSALSGSSSFGTSAGQAQATTTITVSATPDGGDQLDPKPAAKPGSSVSSAGSISVSDSLITVTGLERAAVIRIGMNLEVEKVWKSDSESVLAIALVPEAPAEVFVATDKEGRIYRVNEQGEIALEAQTDRDQITKLVTSKGARWIATAHTGELLRWSSSPAANGTYISTTRDAKTVAGWGRLSWRGSQAPGTAPETNIEFQTRSGNSTLPDASWSGWSEAIKMQSGQMESSTWRGGSIASPPARYIQWKAVLSSSSGASPALEAVRLTYLPRNRAPKIDSIDISTAAAADASSSHDSTTGSTDSSASYSITVSDVGTVASPADNTGGADPLAAGLQRRLKISWSATDPDGDDLLAAVSFQGDGESTWKQIEEKLDKKSLAIDSDSLADGTYRFRIEVSDAKANPAHDVRSASRVSEPVVVDHTPPLVRLLGIDKGPLIRFEARDAASILRRAEYSVDAGAWVPILADDGIVDSMVESFTVRLSGVDDAEHLVTLRVRDWAGNAGLAKAVVR